MRGHPLVPTIGRTLALLVGYVGLVVWLTWPLAASAWSSMPMTRSQCLYDMYYSAWALAHDTHALVSSTTHFADGMTYHPAPNTLFYGPGAFGALPLFAPAFLLTGNPGFAINVTFVMGLALTGMAVHWVVWRWTGSDLAGIVGSTTVVFNQWLVWDFVPTAPHWAPLYGFPLIAYVAATRLHTLRSALWLVPLVVLQCLVDLVYVAPAVLGPLGVLAGFLLLRRRTRGPAVRLIVVLGLSVLVLLPVYRGYLVVTASNTALATQTKWRVTEAALPTVLPDHLLHGRWPFVITPVAMALVPLGAVARAWRRRSGATPPVAGGWAQGALWMLAGGVLAMNPLVLIAGRRIATPIDYGWRWVPALHAIRVPSRLGVAGLVGLGILSGVAFGEIVALLRSSLRRQRETLVIATGLAAGVVGLVYHAYVGNYQAGFLESKVMPTQYRVRPTPTVPGIFVPILASSRAPVLELPVGVDLVDPGAHALAMFHAISHQHPILNGYSSYWPAGFPERMREAAQLPSRAALDHLVQTTGLGLVWVHTQRLALKDRIAWAYPPAAARDHSGLTLVAREGPELLFEVTPPTAPRAAGD